MAGRQVVLDALVADGLALDEPGRARRRAEGAPGHRHVGRHDDVDARRAARRLHVPHEQLDTVRPGCSAAASSSVGTDTTSDGMRAHLSTLPARRGPAARLSAAATRGDTLGASAGARVEEAVMVPEINYWAVLIATASSMVVGSIWYTPKVFGTRWSKLANVDMDRPAPARRSRSSSRCWSAS